MLIGRRSAVDALLRIYFTWRGNRDKLPDIAIVDWHGVPTTTEFHLFVDYFARYGIRVTICDPHEMEFRDGVLYANGRPVDYVYKRYLDGTAAEVWAGSPDHPRPARYLHGQSLPCKMVHKKASFAVASDERNAYLFNETEREAIRQHIPWTRVVEERMTFDVHGSQIDLLPWASGNKEHLVLKPNDEYGGKGVLIGWETEQQVWNDALQAASTILPLSRSALIAYEEFPSFLPDGELDISRRLVDCDPFI